MKHRQQWAGAALGGLDLLLAVAVHGRHGNFFLFLNFFSLLVSGLLISLIFEVPKKHFENRRLWCQAAVNAGLLILHLTIFQYLPPQLGVLFGVGGSFWLLAWWDWLGQQLQPWGWGCLLTGVG